ncbi:MAG: phenylalanine--tRNA ligase subunit beta, partial [Maribacter sp.]|nr:phenylalanine--tRNA ligase subunit beta [Maribacter sp.]
READVIEEILRVYGYNNIDFKDKLNASIAPISKFEDYKLQDKIGDFLAARGFYEIMTNSLTSPTYIDLIDDYKKEQSVVMLNPLSTDLSVMRQTMLLNGLETISYNINRKNQNLRFFEFGKTYHSYSDKRVENKHLSLLITGNRNNTGWVSPEKQTDFFFFKSVVENVLRRLGISKVNSNPLESDVFTEGLTLVSKKKKIVDFGVVNKSLTKKFDVKQEVLYADFYWDNVIDLVPKSEVKFKPIPKYPEVKRDFALLLDNAVRFKEIHDMAFQTERSLLKSVNLFDVYTGDKLPEGKKSYAVSFTLQDYKSTLTDKQIDKIMSKLQQKYEKELGAELR